MDDVKPKAMYALKRLFKTKHNADVAVSCIDEGFSVTYTEPDLRDLGYNKYCYAKTWNNCSPEHYQFPVLMKYKGKENVLDN